MDSTFVGDCPRRTGRPTISGFRNTRFTGVGNDWIEGTDTRYCCGRRRLPAGAPSECVAQPIAEEEERSLAVREGAGKRRGGNKAAAATAATASSSGIVSLSYFFGR